MNLNYVRRFAVSLAFGIVTASVAFAQQATDNVVIVLDSSGSMGRPLPGYSLAITGQMQVRGEARPLGVHTPDECIPGERSCLTVAGEPGPLGGLAITAFARRAPGGVGGVRPSPAEREGRGE